MSTVTSSKYREGGDLGIGNTNSPSKEVEQVPDH